MPSIPWACGCPRMIICCIWPGRDSRHPCRPTGCPTKAEMGRFITSIGSPKRKLSTTPPTQSTGRSTSSRNRRWQGLIWNQWTWKTTIFYLMAGAVSTVPRWDCWEITTLASWIPAVLSRAWNSTPKLKRSTISNSRWRSKDWSESGGSSNPRSGKSTKRSWKKRRNNINSNCNNYSKQNQVRFNYNKNSKPRNKNCNKKYNSNYNHRPNLNWDSINVLWMAKWNNLPPSIRKTIRWNLASTSNKRIRNSIQDNKNIKIFVRNWLRKRKENAGKGSKYLPRWK